VAIRVPGEGFKHSDLSPASALMCDPAATPRHVGREPGAPRQSSTRPAAAFPCLLRRNLSLPAPAEDLCSGVAASFQRSGQMLTTAGPKDRVPTRACCSPGDPLSASRRASHDQRSWVPARGRIVIVTGLTLWGCLSG
jgi:hypothetical protein